MAIRELRSGKVLKPGKILRDRTEEPYKPYDGSQYFLRNIAEDKKQVAKKMSKNV